MSELIDKSPMNIGKILDKSINFIFKNILWITLIGFIMSFLPLSFEMWISTAESMNQSVVSILNIIVGLLITSVGILFAGMVTILLGEHFCGRKITWYQGFKKSIKKWIHLILLNIVITIAIMLGFILLIIPGIIVMCATICAIPAMMLEDLRPIKAFRRSWDLTKKNRFRILGYVILYCVVLIIINLIPALITMTVPIDPIYQIGISALILPPFYVLSSAIATLLFFDLRIRKEAMDLEEEANLITVGT